MKNELNEFLGSHRKQFEKGELLEENTPDNPFPLFENWLNNAIKAELLEPYAMTLSTVVDNKPNSRIVYVRELYQEGMVFFTNYLSQKGLELEQNNHASLLFFWPEVERQIRIHGKVEKAPQHISDDYFNMRPRNSQIGTYASEQSRIIESRKVLDERMVKFGQQFKEHKIPRPENWGGYVFYPNYYEFWQGRPSRLHDRICYDKQGGTWKKYRIAP